MEIEDVLDKGEYVLCGVMLVDVDMEFEYFESVCWYLGGIVDVYFVCDDVVSIVLICLFGFILCDDVKVVDRWIQKFVYDYCSVGVILWCGWNNLWKWFVVGLDW